MGLSFFQRCIRQQIMEMLRKNHMLYPAYKATPEIKKFLSRFIIGTQHECWEWLAGKSPAGYGQIVIKRRTVPAHRLSYEYWVGPIPQKHDIDHLCRNRGCVNPYHLEPVTRRENLIRGEGFVPQNAAKTHCIRGHPLEGKNLFINKLGRRQCRICRNKRQCRYQREKRQKQDSFHA